MATKRGWLHVRVALSVASVSPLLPLLGAQPFEPTDCSDCQHRQEPDGGHCHMFREPPSTKCGQRLPIKETPHGA